MVIVIDSTSSSSMEGCCDGLRLAHGKRTACSVVFCISCFSMDSAVRPVSLTVIQYSSIPSYSLRLRAIALRVRGFIRRLHVHACMRFDWMTVLISWSGSLLQAAIAPLIRCLRSIKHAWVMSLE